MRERFKISSRAARSRYQQHRWKGWVQGKQKGVHGSNVWLTIRRDGDEGEQGGNGGRVVAEYQTIIAHYAKEKAIPLLPLKEIRLLPWLPSKGNEVPPCHPLPPFRDDSPASTGHQGFCEE